MHKLLKDVYTEAKLPKNVQEMSFNDYAQLIGNGDCYKYFIDVFGPENPQRNRVGSKLKVIRDIRNDVFHFKREVSVSDVDILLQHRDWLKPLAFAFEGNNQKRPQDE